MTRWALLLTASSLWLPACAETDEGWDIKPNPETSSDDTDPAPATGLEDVWVRPDSFDGESWTVTFDLQTSGSCTLSTNGSTPSIERCTWELHDGTRLVLDGGDCAQQGQAAGAYDVVVSESDLQVVTVHDPCLGRAQQAAGEWTRE